MYASKSLPRAGTHSPALATGLAFLSLFCGVLGFFFLSLLMAPLAVLTGYLALRQGNRTAPGDRRRTTAARAGIVLGGSILVIYALLLVTRA
ncbi:DUF4190 domain-containing protein [Streptomyces sp. NPDC000594]|uniref:DUF4190 domain-containing protein n=1 Tax=Streptomyces sp. NPDC000594 TaxID=3154261 RepID=UPI003324EEB3